MKTALAPYVGKTIAINLNHSRRPVQATLQAVYDDAFRITVEGDANVYWMPYRVIEHIAENPAGVSEGHLIGRISTDAPLFIRLALPGETVIG